MINKLTEKQVVDTFAKYQPHITLDLPLDMDNCLWVYFTLDELEQQVQRFITPGEKFDKIKYDAYAWLNNIVRQRRDAWLEFGNVSDVHYVEVTK